jgi:2-keto-4-pentenoate hydratase
MTQLKPRSGRIHVFAHPAGFISSRACARVPSCDTGEASARMAHPVTAVSWVAQYLHLMAATGRSGALHSGQVLVGSGSPNTVVPRRRM